MKTLLFIIITPFILGVLVSMIEFFSVKQSVTQSAAKTTKTTEKEFNPILEDRKDNLDRQIDGYNQLLIMLDKQYRMEDDPKKQAVILNKQLTTLEKYNKAIERRSKLGD